MISDKSVGTRPRMRAARRMPSTDAHDARHASLVFNALVYWPRRFVKEMTAQPTRMLENGSHAESFGALYAATVMRPNRSPKLCAKAPRRCGSLKSTFASGRQSNADTGRDQSDSIGDR